MLLSDGTGLLRLAKLVAGIALVGALASCQVRPLYSTGAGTDTKLSAVAISQADDRVEQQVRNDLIFLFAGGAGEAQNAIYHLELNVSVRNIGVLIDVTDDISRAGRIVVSADYNLTKTETGETVTSGKRSSVALVDFPVQEFAKLRAVRDAENRAARELAELIRADVASALARR
ncbi:LPS assembly lipoprotein LptE [Shinella sp. CPCC 101442]|uniref:LPS assembly lipoprotein LptE n=1 Tax=Shinella sp. CPCC 101442 TaxID=2932265 RepID=UPI0021538F81|nr:LPS assembly lipoprotein LptE [Shinella sp. CPCC 101442]MCR6501483.1 LPS assembly lipoprotein LptE [Shinella sp. CPCC 101442]